MSKWIPTKQKENIKETILASHDKIKDWHPDKTGYFLIRINRKDKTIELGFCTYKHTITKKLVGKNAVELYHTVIKHKLVSRFEHAAYLGKELYKAELCLRYAKKYTQGSPISFTKYPQKVKLTNS